MTLQGIYAKVSRIAAAVVALAGAGAAGSLLLGPAPAAAKVALVLVAAFLVVGAPLTVALRRSVSPGAGVWAFFLAGAGGAVIAGARNIGLLSRPMAICAVAVAFPMVVLATLLRTEASLNRPKNRL
jgi:hypothetical protein